MTTQQPLQPQLGRPVDLQAYDPDYYGDFTKPSAREEIRYLQMQMQVLQEKLYAEGKQALLIVLQAMDAGGKDGTIKKVFEGINPQGVWVFSFKAPSDKEQARDFLWRVHRRIPAKGQIAIFNRSHYEDVLVARVKRLVSQDVWERRYGHINNFERLLSDSGIRILKFFLHISKAEQEKRLRERLVKPEKHWKFSTADLLVREQWDDYMAAYEAALSRCHTAYAPWHIVPANRKWYRNLVVTRTIVQMLEAMNPTYPPPAPELETVTIPG